MTDYTGLVKALRIRSGNLCPGDICDRCEAIHFLCSDKVMHDAAAAIEELQAELVGSKDAIRILKHNLEMKKPKRGEWKETDMGWDGDTAWVCSVCGEPWTLIDGTPKENNMNYCPNCGAKMEVQDG